MLNLEELVKSFEVFFITSSTVYKLLRWFYTLSQNQYIIYCIHTAIDGSFLYNILQRKFYMLLRLETFILPTKKNLFDNFFYDNFKLFFASYFFVKFVQGVIKDNFLLFIIISDFYHNLI